MFARLFRAFKVEPSRPRHTARLRCEQLEVREMLDVKSLVINTDADTAFDKVNADGIPVDVNGMTSLRVVAQFTGMANNIITGDWATNHYAVRIAAPTNTLTISEGPLPELKSNFYFIASGTTIERSAVAQFRLFSVAKDTESHFLGVTFRNGWALGLSGGAFLNSGKLHLDQCNFYDNHATTDGGAICSASFATELRITRSGFWLNSAKTGGAISIRDKSNLFITESSIFANWATAGANPTGVEGWGGAICLNAMEATQVPEIRDTAIYGNWAVKGAGGILVLGTAFTMTNGIIHGNSAEDGDGGGLYVFAQDKTTTLTNVTMTENTASGKGGGAYVWFGTLDGDLASLTGNTATGGIPGIAYKKGQGTAPIMVPVGQQTKVEDP